MPLPLAGATIKASDLAAIFPVGVDAWTTYTPTLTQSVTVTKTVSYARYMKVGRKVIAQGALGATSAGTAANVVLFGLPVPAAGPGQLDIGTAMLFDASAGLFYAGVAVIQSSTEAKFIASGNNNYIGISGFTAALASADYLTFHVEYESAS